MAEERRKENREGCADGREVVISENHTGRFFAHRRAGDTHGDADVGVFQGRRIVDAVTSHGNDMAARPPTSDAPA